MEITITAQILDGNLGDGWKDNYRAALALAEFTEKTWAEDIAGSDLEDIAYTIDIDVQKNVEGASREMEVDCSDYNLTRRVESVLTPESMIWDRFCRSETAEKHYKD